MTAATLAFTSKETVINAYGDVGVDILAADFAQSLQSAGGRDITISLFSYGGDAAQGLAIYDQLARYSGRVTVVIDGVAASAASLLAMAADRVVMPSNALLMIHDPWSMAAGNADTMRSSADMLDSFSKSYAQSYARKSGASLEVVTGWMSAGAGAGTWFTADEAVAAGLADEVAPAAEIRAAAPRLPAGRFSNAPEALALWASPTQQSPTSFSPMTANTQAAAIDPTTAEAAQEGELSKADANRALAIHRSAATAGLTNAEAEAIIASTKTTQEGLMAVITAHASVIEGRAGAAGHPARQYVGPNGGHAQGLEGAIGAALRGERHEPLWLALRASGLGHGNDPTSVWRSALSGDNRWAARATISTSDLPTLLQESGNRRLLEQFQVADAGVRLAASVRQLNDYRAASVVDVGLVGSASEILEVGEIKFSSIDEAAASYKPKRVGLGTVLSPESLANDDLSALDAALSEMAAAVLDAEALALVDLLEGSALGRNAPDGKSLFHADHGNVVSTGPLGIGAIGSAVERLRNQKALGGRYIAQEPAALLVGSAMETTARQLLSSAINAAQASNVNPWSNLEIAVDPRLSGTYSYVIGSARKPLELGRLSPAPIFTSEVAFSTGNFRAKTEHQFGAIVADHRSIVRLVNAA
jgi:ATP-dependent protease ClpP protease subunit